MKVFLLNATLLLLLGGGAFGLVVLVRQALRADAQTYLFNMRGQILSIRGTRLKSAGLCTQVWMHDRLDAIICEPHIVVPEARIAEEGKKPVVY